MPYHLVDLVKRHFVSIVNIGFLFFGIALLLLFFKNTDPYILFGKIAALSWWWLIWPKAFSIMGNAFRAFRWRLLLETRKNSVSTINAFIAIMLGYLASLAFPKIGQLARCTALKQLEEIPVSFSAGTIILERFIDTFVLLILILLSFLLHFELIIHFINLSYETVCNTLTAKPYEPWQALLLIILLTIVLLTLIWFVKQVKKHQNRFFDNFLNNLKQGFFAFRQLNNKWKYVIYSAGVWLAYFLNFHFMFYAIGSLYEPKLEDSIFVFAASSIGNSLPIQANIGAYHWSVTEALRFLELHYEIALAWAFGSHISGVSTTLLVGFLSVLALYGKKRINQFNSFD